MTIIRDGEIVAFYADRVFICPACADRGDSTEGDRTASFLTDELEGAIDMLRCDHCGAGIFSFH